jgi:hypothetical protein
MSNEQNRFDNLDRRDRVLLFEALLHCIDSNSGIGFDGSDQGHSCYRVGAEGADPLGHYKSSPDRNCIYQMLRELSLHLADDAAVTGIRPHFITDWQAFCQRAVHAHDTVKHTYVPLHERSV